MPIDRVTRRDWILNCAAGEFLGLAVAAGAAVGLTATWGEPDTALAGLRSILLITLAGCVEGVAVASFQHRVLRRVVPVPWRPWLVATVAVAAAGWFLGSFPATFLAPSGDEAAGAEPAQWLQIVMGAGMGAALGALFGWAQYLVLRRHATPARPWIGYNALGWGLAFVWIFLVATSVPAGASVAEGVFAGAVAGVLSGVSIGSVTLPAVARLRPAAAAQG